MNQLNLYLNMISTIQLSLVFVLPSFGEESMMTVFPCHLLEEWVDSDGG